jgi:hypothetical protein
MLVLLTATVMAYSVMKAMVKKVAKEYKSTEGNQ